MLSTVPDNVQNYASKPSAELLQKLKDKVGDWDEDAYLDPSVMKFCADTLIAHGLPPKITNANKGDPTHQTVYRLLHKKLEEYEKIFEKFSDCRPPKGGKQWM